MNWISLKIKSKRKILIFMKKMMKLKD